MTKEAITADLILLKIDASRCTLRTGDRVSPDLEIGNHWETGEPLKAGCYGCIVAITFSETDHALIILVSTEPPPGCQDTPSDLVFFKVDTDRGGLQAGDPVTPAMVVGNDLETGEPVIAGCHGRVVTVSFSGADEARIVVIRCDNVIGSEDRSPKSPVVFKISANRCDLHPGDRVEANTVVGQDFESGDIITAGVNGVVRAINFDGGDHALIVVIEPE